MSDRYFIEKWITGNFHEREYFSMIFPKLATRDEMQSLEAALQNWADATQNIDISDVDGLQEELDGKALASHTHAISDIIDLVEILSEKSDVGHLHNIENVSGLQTALDGKISKTPKASAISNTATTITPASVTILGISVPTNSSYIELASAHNALKDKVNVILSAMRSRDIIEP